MKQMLQLFSKYLFQCTIVCCFSISIFATTIEEYSFKDLVILDLAAARREADFNNKELYFTEYYVLTNDRSSPVSSIETPIFVQQNLGPSFSGKALVYPNPFSIRRSNDVNGNSGGVLGYRINNQAMATTLHIHDKRGNKIAEKTYPANSEGGTRGYNHVNINLESLGIGSLPAGPYFFILTGKNNQKIKGKFVVIP